MTILFSISLRVECLIVCGVVFRNIPRNVTVTLFYIRYFSYGLRLNIQENHQNVIECRGRIQGHYPVYLLDSNTTRGSWIDNGTRERVVLGSPTAPINSESHETLLRMPAVSSKSRGTTTSWTSSSRSHIRKSAIQSCGRGLCRANQIPERIEERSKVIYSVV